MPLPIIETAAKQVVQDMAERSLDATTYARKVAAERKLAVLQGNWRGMAQNYASSLYKSDHMKRAIAARVKTTTNVLKQVTEQVCVAYEREPLRTIDGASADQAKAYARVMAEAEAEVKGLSWERKTFATGCTVVVPVVRRGRLSYLQLLPHCFELIADPEDPMGDPLALVVEMINTSDRPDDRFTYAVLDDQRWSYYDRNFLPVGEPTYHNAGIFPGQPFRLSDPVDDWFDQFRTDGLFDATMEVAHIRARMDWVRHNQDRKKEYLFSDRIDQIPSQVVGAETAVEVPLAPDRVEVIMQDGITPIQEFRAHARDHIEAACESFGIPVSAVDISALVESVTPLGHLISHKHAEKMRAEHAKFCKTSEAMLAYKTTLVMRGMGHPDAKYLPPSLVKSGFQIEYIASPFLQDPETQLRVDKAEVNQGLISTYRVYMRRHPGVTFEEAVEAVNRIAEEEADLDTRYIQHGLPRDSELRGASREKILGVIGGQRSGQVRADPMSEEGEDDGR
jgi:hypothetical protein